jgi:hypothetical protein
MCCQRGAVSRAPNKSNVAPIFDGERQAQLIALACAKPPDGHTRWTIRLLAEHVVERTIVAGATLARVAPALKERQQTAREGILVIRRRPTRRLGPR